MKRKKSQMDDAVRMRLIEQLEAERQAGIPSVPESLMPENIEGLLKAQRRRGGWLVRAVEGGLAVTMAAALLFLILLPNQGKSNSMDQFAGSAVLTNETQAATTMQRTDVMDGAEEAVYEEAADVSGSESGGAVAGNSVMDAVINTEEKPYSNKNAELTEGKKEDETEKRVLYLPEGAGRPESFEIKEYKARE